MLCIDLQCKARQCGPYKNWYILCSTPSTGLLSGPYYLLFHTVVLVKISTQLMLWNIQKSTFVCTASLLYRNNRCPVNCMTSWVWLFPCDPSWSWGTVSRRRLEEDMAGLTWLACKQTHKNYLTVWAAKIPSLLPGGQPGCPSQPGCQLLDPPDPGSHLTCMCTNSQKKIISLADQHSLPAWLSLPTWLSLQVYQISHQTFMLALLHSLPALLAVIFMFIMLTICRNWPLCHSKYLFYHANFEWSFPSANCTKCLWSHTNVAESYQMNPNVTKHFRICPFT